LRALFLDENKISEIQPTLFNTLTKLQELEIQNNPLTYLPNATFDNLKALQTLIIDAPLNEKYTLCGPENKFQSDLKKLKEQKQYSMSIHTDGQQAPLQLDCGCYGLSSLKMLKYEIKIKLKIDYDEFVVLKHCADRNREILVTEVEVLNPKDTIRIKKGIELLIVHPECKFPVLLCSESLDDLKVAIQMKTSMKEFQLEQYNIDYQEYVLLTNLSNIHQRTKLRLLPIAKDPRTLIQEVELLNIQLEKERKAQSQALAALAAQLKSEQQTLESKNTTIQEMEATVLQMKKDADKAQATIDQLQKRLETSSNLSQALTEELKMEKQTSQQKDETIKDLNLKIDRTNQELNSTQKELSLVIDKLKICSDSLEKESQVIQDFKRKDIFEQGGKLTSRCWDPFLPELKIRWNKPESRFCSTSRIPELEKDIVDYFYQSVPQDVKISKIEFVQNFCLQKKFESTLMIMSRQGHEDESSPMGKRFIKTHEKEAVLKRFSDRYERVAPNDKIKVVQTWVGTSPSVVDVVCNTGLADVRLTDKGFFGAGIYSTLQADYARVYAEGRYFGATPIPANQDGEHCLLLCWVAVGNVYPISRNDYGRNLPFSNFYHEDNGLALNPGFDSHCACVYLDDRKLFQAAKFNHDKEAFDQDPKTLVDEIVVKESAQILPYCIVYYKNSKN